MEVRVVRSRRRKRTLSARMVRDLLVVRVPASITDGELEDAVADFAERFRRRRLREELNRAGGLEERARRLNERYFGGAVRWASVEYVTGQEGKFGCCDVSARRIRISHRVAGMPAWVRDYVLVHEMAHLLSPRHDRPFWDLVSRYPLAERARGYLIAVGREGGDGAGGHCPPGEAQGPR